MLVYPKPEQSLSRSQIIGHLEAACQQLGVESKIALFRIYPKSDEQSAFMCRLTVGAGKGSTEANSLHSLSQKLEQQAQDDLAIVLQYDDISPAVAEYSQRLTQGLPISPDFGLKAPPIKERVINPKHYQDLRNLPFFTIDPAETRDIDDAIAVVDNILYIAFADVTPLISSWSDPLIHYAGRFGQSLYAANYNSSHLMLGATGERISLFQDRERFAWVVKIPLTDKYPEGLNDFEIFRAKIYTQANLNYQTTAEEISDPVVRASFLEARRATLALETLRLEKNPIAVEKSEYESERLVSVAMVTAKNLIAKFLAEKTKCAFYRVHQPDLKTEHFNAWLEGLGASNQNLKFTTTDFENPERLLRLIRRCMHNEKLEVRAMGQEIFNHYVGVATFSLAPDLHSGLKLRPFADIKALRKFDGLLNQLILESVIYGHTPMLTPTEMKPFLNQLLKSKRDYLTNYALLRVYNRHQRGLNSNLLSESFFGQTLDESEDGQD